MMLKRFYFLLGVILLVTVLSGCSGSGNAAQSTQNQNTAVLDNQFTLIPGQTIHLDSEAMDIKFIDVSLDTRCADGDICISSGQVLINVEITQNGTKTPITMTEMKGSGMSGGYIYQHYKILFAIGPTPQTETTIAPADYRLSLTVSKTS